MQKNLTRIFFLLTLISVINLHATEIYPKWFLFPPEYPDLFVGYTYNGMSAESDAANMYYAFKECIVVGTLEIFENELSDELLKNSNYFYYFSPDSVDSLQDRLNPVDHFDVSAFSKDQVLLYMLDELAAIDAPRVDANTLPVPSWKDKDFYQDQQYYYGVGMYTALGSENDGWKTAEEQAIFSILTTLSVQVHNIRVVSKYNENNMQSVALDQISFLKIKYLLRNIEIVERYPDRENKLYYVLVRIPKNGVVSPLLR